MDTVFENILVGIVVLSLGTCLIGFLITLGFLIVSLIRELNKLK